MGASPHHGFAVPAPPPARCSRCPAPTDDTLVTYHCPGCGSQIHCHLTTDMLADGPAVVSIRCTFCDQVRQLLVLSEDLAS